MEQVCVHLAAGSRLYHYSLLYCLLITVFYLFWDDLFDLKHTLMVVSVGC